MQILVVEDDSISRRLMCRYLQPLGECDEAVNGAEAIAAVRRLLADGRTYDLICLDIMMPGVGGQEALEEIRRLEVEHGLAIGHGSKIIMTTALEDSGNIRRAFRAAADSYVVKPIDKRKFYVTMQEIGLDVKVLS